jgi:Zn-finger nucleic acid-binding protein
MSDAYRTSGRTCPTCGNAALREFSGRLVCDECNGMLLDADDLAKSISELDGRSGGVTFTDEGPAGKACPRCAGELQFARVEVSTLILDGPLMHCERDGVWVPQTVLAGAFALASRRGHAGSMRNTRFYGGVGGGVGGGSGGGAPLPGVTGGFVGAMNSIGAAFGAGPSATAGLAISQWATARPRVHTLFVSAFKDRTLGCPACKDTKLQFAGDRWACAACGGCFVEDAALSAMVIEMTGRPWQPPAVQGGPGERACPVCDKPMIVEVLEAVTIDRCEGHGAYFDPDELQAALKHAAEPQHVGSFLQRLFHRHHEE